MKYGPSHSEYDYYSIHTNCYTFFHRFWNSIFYSQTRVLCKSLFFRSRYQSTKLSCTADSNEKCAEADTNRPAPPEADINQNKLVSGSGAAIPVGIHPIGIVANPQNGKIYVANAASDTVSVILCGININGFKVTSTIPVGNNPIDVALNPSNGKVYVTNIFSNTISVIDSKNDRLLSTIPVPLLPIAIAINPFDSNIYASHFSIFDSNTVSLIDGKNDTLVNTVPVREFSVGIAANPQNGKIYVANAGSDTVSVTDSNTLKVINTIPVGNNPIDVALNPSNGKSICDQLFF